MKRILLVEDDAILLRRFKKELSARFLVTTASTLDEAQKLLDTRRFDLVLTDMHLTPDQNAEGLQVLRHKNRLNCQAKRLAMSSDYCMKDSCLNAGAARFFEKPFALGAVT